VIRSYRDKNPRIGAGCYIDETAVVIGDVELGENSSVWPLTVIRGDINSIRIGAGTNIQDGTVVHVSREKYGTYIGDHITIGHMALIHACTLEDGSFVGMQATVMDGCVVDSGAMVAAGALITPGKRVGPGQLWAGTPAKRIRDLSEADSKSIAATAPHYVRLAREYRDAIHG
jgi:carbonic anhydrase/acetyltransferase-like protein (isoleucine patch superfamily)